MSEKFVGVIKIFFFLDFIYLVYINYLFFINVFLLVFILYFIKMFNVF